MSLRTALLETTPDPDDDTLIARVAARDADAFRLMADRYSNLLFSIAYRMCNDRAGAEDILQDSLLRIWSHAAQWSPARGASVKTWICTITTNLCIDHSRKAGRERLGDPPDRADPASNAELALSHDQTATIVGSALQALPARQRLALVLFHYENLSMAEVAHALDISPKAAEGLLTRGRAALRQMLTPHRKDI